MDFITARMDSLMAFQSDSQPIPSGTFTDPGTRIFVVKAIQVVAAGARES